MLTAKELADTRANVVANFANPLDGLSFRILERPVLSLQTGNDRALLAASHGDQHVGAARQLVGELLRRLAGQVDPDFAHRREDLGVDAHSGVGTGGDGARLRAVRERVEPCSGHLRSAGVVDAGENDGLHGRSSLGAARSTTRSATAGRAGTSQRKSAVDAAAPASCATMK